MSLVHGHGLVIGKFLPPHAGHHLVIETALRACATVTVVVCDLAGQRPDAATRAAWLRRIHPAARVVLHDDLCGPHRPCPPACSQRWGAALRAALPPVDAVFTSERYGDAFAEALGAVHVAVDPARVRVRVSGSAVREDVARAWRWLHPVVREGLVRRVVIVGAESTGTTTLAADLAAALGAPWTPEHGRAVSAQKAAEGTFGTDGAWSEADFLAIDGAQAALEEAAVAALAMAPSATPPRIDGLELLGPVVVCDTDVLATYVWSERYLGRGVDALLRVARRRPPLVYVLTEPDIPFVQDGLRDGEHLRCAMTQRFAELLDRQATPWCRVGGRREERVAAALDALVARAVEEPVLRQPGATGA